MSTELMLCRCRPETIASRRQTVEKAVVAMQATISEPLSLDSMARAVMVSPSQLDHVFRAITGISPRKYMSALRLAHAKRLLLSTDLKIIDICLDTGYSSVGTFSRRFANSVAVPPLRLRRLLDGILGHMRDLRGGPVHPGTYSEGVHGKITAPPGFRGIIFIGLFNTPMPEGKPKHCTILCEAGEFAITDVRDGDYYTFAIGFEWTEDALAYLQNENALRASSQPMIVRVCGGKSRTNIVLELRQRWLSDPPILVAIPALLQPPGLPSAALTRG